MKKKNCRISVSYCFVTYMIQLRYELDKKMRRASDKRFQAVIVAKFTASDVARVSVNV